MTHSKSRPLHRGRLFVLCVLLLGGLAHAAERPVAFFEVTSWTRSKALPLEGFYNNLNTSLNAGHTATTRTQARIGAQYGAFSLAYLRRYDVEATLSRDALELIYITSNKQPLPIGRRFDLKIRPWLLSAQAVQAGWRFANDSDDWSLEPRLSLLKSDDLIDGTLDGNATAIDDKTYEYAAEVDYVYRRDALLRREVDAPRGYGFSLDLAGHWQASPQALLRWDLRDLYGRVYWGDAPHTRATATSDTRSTDANGFTQFRPTLSGIENNIRHTQKLRPAGELQGEYRLPLLRHTRFTALATYVWTQTDTLATLGLRHAVGSHLDVAVSTTPRFDALGLGLTTRYGTVQWLADRPDFKNIHTLRSQISLAYAF